MGIKLTGAERKELEDATRLETERHGKAILEILRKSERLTEGYYTRELQRINNWHEGEMDRLKAYYKAQIDKLMRDFYGGDYQG